MHACRTSLPRSSAQALPCAAPTAACARAAIWTTRRRRPRCATRPMPRSSCCRTTAASTGARVSSRARRRPPTRARALPWRRSRARLPIRSRCSCATRPRRSTCWRIACPRKRACCRRRGSITPTCFPGAGARSTCSRSRVRPTSSWLAARRRWRAAATTSSRSREPRTSPARSCRCASSRRSRTAMAPRSASMPPSSRRTRRSTCRLSGSTISRSRATSSTRPSASAC